MKSNLISMPTLCLLGLISICLSCSVSARGLLGVDYIGFEYGGLRPGDDNLRAIDSFVTTAALGCNFSFNKNVDLGLAIGSVEKVETAAGKIESVSVLGGVYYHSSPGYSVDPFVGINLGFVDTVVDNGVQTISQDEFTFNVEGGLEFDLSERMALRPGLLYEWVDDADEISINVDLNYWIVHDIFVGVSAAHGFDAGDTLFALIAGFAL